MAGAMRARRGLQLTMRAARGPKQPTSCLRATDAGGGRSSDAPVTIVAPNNAKVVVLPDADAIAENAAERMLARIAQTSSPAAICLTGGAGPQRLYALLAREPYRRRVP